jgi:exodeoxyribonuclease V alpha subunit
MTELKGYIKYIKFIKDNNEENDETEDLDSNEKNYFLIAEIIDENNNDHIIKGNTIINPEEFDEIICNNCILLHNTKYNRDEYSTDDLINISLPSNNDLIKDRLIKLNIDGYGEKTINKIVENYGSKIWDIQYLKTINDKLIKDNFISDIENYINNRDKTKDEYSYILDYLIKKFNISLNQREYEKVKYFINDDFKQSIINNTEIDNLLLEDLVLNLTGCISMNKIDKICKSFNLSGTIYDKIKILGAIRDNINFGSACINKEKLKNINNLEQLLFELNEYIVEYNNYIYDKKQYYFETNIAIKLKKIYNYQYNKEKLNDINEFEEEIELNEEQINAMYNAFNNPISIITGGPGCGKTTTIKTILKVSKLKEHKFTILAPTGKVVSKIVNDLEIKDKKESQVMTIHKFIGIFKYEKRNDTKITEKYEDKQKHHYYEHIINSNFIIIDEFSMVSNRLFSDFLNYIAENEIKIKLILIGDCNQLPSIDCGNVLDSLMASKCIPITNLIKPMRQKEGSVLIDIINNIKEGKIPNNNNDFKFIKTNNDDDFKFKLYNLAKEQISINGMNELMIISPTRKKIITHTSEIRKIHHNNSKTKFEENCFSINDHIILTKNIYIYQQSKYKFTKTERIIDNFLNDITTKIEIPQIISNFDLFNGMIGIIENILIINNCEYYLINFGNDITGNFEKDFFNKKDICTFSYINTIHKYQGSENKIAIVLINNSDNGMANRNLIYTAISRAREKCIVIGEETVFHKAINKKVRRLSKLNEMIRETFINKSINDILDIEGINYSSINSNKKGIPTFGYNHILFRSRIEAKWSYFFNILKWEYSYEPFDLNGYIPDFIIKKSSCGNIINLLIEVKGDVDDKNFDSYYEKAWTSGWQDALLILNSGFENTKNKNFKNGIILGQLYFPVSDMIEVSNFIIYKNETHEFSHVFSYVKNYYNCINRNCILDKPITIINNTELSDNKNLHSKWNYISNLVQFKKPDMNENIEIIELNNNNDKSKINENINNQIIKLEKQKQNIINNYNIDIQNINAGLNEYYRKENELANKLQQLEKEQKCFYCTSNINNKFACIQHNYNNLLDYNNCFFVCKCCTKLSIKIDITKNYNKKGCFNCNGCEFCIKGLPKKPKETMYIISFIKCLYCDNNINYNYNEDNIINIPKSAFNKKINDPIIKAKIDEYKDNIIIIDNRLQNDIDLIKDEIIDIQKYIYEINTTINNMNINHTKSLKDIGLKIKELNKKNINTNNKPIVSVSYYYSTDTKDNYNHEKSKHNNKNIIKSNKRIKQFGINTDDYIYLNVKYELNNEIKKIGGTWDNRNKLWYILKFKYNKNKDYIHNTFGDPITWEEPCEECGGSGIAYICDDVDGPCINCQ